jgi:acyl-CoA thioester hydrolase
MLSNEIRIRVRYGEVDRMGYLHHGNYALFFEEARTELIRKLGLTYREMEDQGILLPVRELHIHYYKPAFYDDEIIIRTSLIKYTSVRLDFDYKMLNSKDELLSEAKTTLVFVDATSRKPTRIPEFFEKLIAPFFSHQI